MSLRFFFGPSGSGKSYQIYKEIIERSMENPRQNFLIIVPDQFTMQTQKELVTMRLMSCMLQRNYMIKSRCFLMRL